MASLSDPKEELSDLSGLSEPTPRPLSQFGSQSHTQLFSVTVLSTASDKSHSIFAELSEDPMTKQQRIELIKSSLEKRQGIDVWQYAAFKLGTQWNTYNGKINQLRLITLSLLPPLLAAHCQFVVLYFIFCYWFDQKYSTSDQPSEVVYLHEESNQSIPMTLVEKHIYLKVTFDIFVLWYAVQLLTSQTNAGLYGAMRYIPKESGDCWFKLHSIPFIGNKLRAFVDYGFLYCPVFAAGFFINQLVWFCCLFNALFLVSTVEDPVNLILNIVAVYFISDIDSREPYPFEVQLSVRLFTHVVNRKFSVKFAFCQRLRSLR